MTLGVVTKCLLWFEKDLTEIKLEEIIIIFFIENLVLLFRQGDFIFGQNQHLLVITELNIHHNIELCLCQKKRRFQSELC